MRAPNGRRACRQTAARWRSRGTARRRTITTSTSSWWGRASPSASPPTAHGTMRQPGRRMAGIAFLRWLPHSDTTVDVMVVPALGHAAERRVGTVTTPVPRHQSNQLDAGWSLDCHRCRRARRGSRDLVAVKGRTRATPPDRLAARRDSRVTPTLCFRPMGVTWRSFGWQGSARPRSTSSHSRQRSSRSAVLYRSRRGRKCIWDSRGQATMRRWCSRPAHSLDSHDCIASPCDRIDWPRRVPRGAAVWRTGRELEPESGRAAGLRRLVQGHQPRAHERGRACEQSHRGRRGPVDLR